MEKENRWLTGIVLLGLLAGILVCLWRITAGPPTSSEALLLSLVLTVLSIIGSWIASRFYADFSFNKNLRMFALKAAEKVTNLSNELDRLSAFFQEELKENDYESPRESLLAKNLRIEGGIHIINTLKSVNDRSLSDWKGVIGEEITAQQHVQEEREETLRELIERVESLSTSVAPHDDGGDEETAKLHSDVESIKTDLRLLAGQVSGIPIRQTRPNRRKLHLEKRCPGCDDPLEYWQRATPNGIKAVDCTNCGLRLYSKEDNGSFSLEVRTPVPEQVLCPNCSQKIHVSLDPVPGTVQDVICDVCKTELRMIRTARTVRVKLREAAGAPVPSAPPGEELLKRVCELMGPQPWPTGRTRTVAKEMGVALGIVVRAVDELVRRGVFKLQIKGRLYVPEAGTPRQNNEM